MINPHVTAADQRVKHRRVIAPIVLKKTAIQLWAGQGPIRSRPEAYRWTASAG